MMANVMVVTNSNNNEFIPRILVVARRSHDTHHAQTSSLGQRGDTRTGKCCALTNREQRVSHFVVQWLRESIIDSYCIVFI